MGKPSKLSDVQDGGRPSNRRPARQGGYQNQVTERQEQPERRIPDKDRCPKGWDQDIWSLTLAFQQYALADRITLAAGRPIIYAELADLVASRDMRARAKAGRYRQAVRICGKRKLDPTLADHCWLHHPPSGGDKWDEYLTWYQMVEVIMAEFWSRIWDEYALDHFRRHFREYGQLAMDHWSNLRVAQRAEERRAMMAADSKEG